MGVHDVGELVVAVHDAGRPVVRPVGTQPAAGLVEARQVAELVLAQEVQPAVDLALVEVLGAAEPGQAARFPVDLGQQGRPADQFKGEASSLLQIGFERFRPLAVAHRRPAVDRLHQVERRAEDPGVVGAGDELSVRQVRALERAQQARLAAQAVEAGRARGGERDAEHRPDAVTLDHEQLVLRATGQPGQDRDAVPRQLLRVHPAAEGRGVDGGGLRRRSRVSHSAPSVTGYPPRRRHLRS